MDLDYSADERAFRDQVRGWLRAHLPRARCATRSSATRRLDRDDLHGLAPDPRRPRDGSHLPGRAEWGGTGWNVVQRYIFEEECGYAGAPPLIPFGLAMCAPVLLEFGTDAQKQRFLPRIYRGDDVWCQGYSEPGSGSDLASLTHLRACGAATATSSTARRSGRRSRTWPTGSSASCAPTPRCERKQDGISFLLIDMKTPGITVRPLDR